MICLNLGNTDRTEGRPTSRYRTNKRRILEDYPNSRRLPQFLPIENPTLLQPPKRARCKKQSLTDS